MTFRVIKALKPLRKHIHILPHDPAGLFQNGLPRLDPRSDPHGHIADYTVPWTIE